MRIPCSNFRETKRCNIVRLGFGDDLLPLRGAAVVLTTLRALCLYSPSRREGVFSETGLLALGLLGNSGIEEGPGRKSCGPSACASSHEVGFTRVRFYCPLMLSFALSISPLSSSSSLANVSTVSTETSTPTKGSSPTIQAS